ncbi:MAG: heme lyase CcmF/NrfE family subunit [Candidatus Methylomirabilales bacterium]
MTAQLGTIALWTALAAALFGAGAAVIGHRQKKFALLEGSHNAVLVHWAMVTIALFCLEYALITSDFSIRYVAFNSSRNYSIWYKIAGLWASLEGSILLWAWMQATLAAQVVLMYRRKHRDFVPYVSAVLMGISTFFVLVMVIPANPFAREFPVPTDGRGLNPLLEDTSMLVHPLLLYSGYVGFTVPYAFAMAALITGRLREEWLYITRRWAVAAWMFLTAGIIYGGWWSYHVLGWGGYWAWDPVENASFMPWLAGTAYIHSVMIQEKRGMLKVWNLTLISLTFALVIFGTFLTRSGILNSVHAFAQGEIGYFFLGFLALILLSTVTLLTYRGDQLRTEGAVDSFLSRESAFLFNNLLLVTFCFTVFLGTLFPLLAEAVRGVKVSVGAPYFNYVAAPIGLGLLFLMGVGPVIPWRGGSWGSLRRNLVGPGVTGLAVAGVAFGFGMRGPLVLLTYALAVFVSAVAVQEYYRGVRARRKTAGEGTFQALGQLFVRNRRRYGGFIVHFGVALLAIGIASSSAFRVEREDMLKKGEMLEAGKYQVRFDALEGSEGPTHVKVHGLFTVFNDRHEAGQMSPALRFYPNRQDPIAEVDHWMGFKEDLYVILGSFDRKGNWAVVKVLVNPMVSWIWIGGAIMALGTFLTLFPFGFLLSGTRGGRT